MTQEKLTREKLQYFTGTTFYYRHPINCRVFYTEGVQYVAEAAGAYWLIDAIASYLTPSYLKPEMEKDARIGDMHFWKLSVAADSSAVLEARADSPCVPFVQQEIEFTDFPLEAIDIWASFDGTNWVLYLPREH